LTFLRIHVHEIEPNIAAAQQLADFVSPSRPPVGDDSNPAKARTMSLRPLVEEVADPLVEVLISGLPRRRDPIID
jgi:hypothetical protein